MDRIYDALPKWFWKWFLQITFLLVIILLIELVFILPQIPRSFSKVARAVCWSSASLSSISSETTAKWWIDICTSGDSGLGGLQKK